MLILILLTLALLLCNVVYCGQFAVADWKQSRHARGVWGLFAFVGAVTALLVMVWALLASLSHY